MTNPKRDGTLTTDHHQVSTQSNLLVLMELFRGPPGMKLDVHSSDSSANGGGLHELGLRQTLEAQVSCMSKCPRYS